MGGASVAKAIKLAIPPLDIVVREDRENLPYGTKTPEQLYGLVVPIFEELIEQGCQLIVVACNTVTTNIISMLRKRFPDTPMVAIEPMVKPAAEMTESGVIAICATPATLASARYNELKSTYAKDIKVLEPDCSDWVGMIEANKIDQDKISGRIEEAISQGADVIVLGCTHYHWIEEEISALAQNRAQVIQPEQAIVAQLKRVLEQLA